MKLPTVGQFGHLSRDILIVLVGELINATELQKASIAPQEAGIKARRRTNVTLRNTLRGNKGDQTNISSNSLSFDHQQHSHPSLCHPIDYPGLTAPAGKQLANCQTTLYKIKLCRSIRRHITGLPPVTPTTATQTQPNISNSRAQKNWLPQFPERQWGIEAANFFAGRKGKICSR